MTELQGLKKIQERKESLERQMKSSRNIDSRLTQAKRQSMIDVFEWAREQFQSDLREIEAELKGTRVKTCSWVGYDKAYNPDKIDALIAKIHSSSEEKFERE